MRIGITRQARRARMARQPLQELIADLVRLSARLLLGRPRHDLADLVQHCPSLLRPRSPSSVAHEIQHRGSAAP
uniref:Uncharacterized protein n=1 Tax=Knipowitschia caucasica TaxID=637954 RepID=A0AAV2JKP3_KNICA